MSTTYLVDVQMALKGDLAGSVRDLTGHFTGLVESAGKFAATIAATGMAAGIGAVTYGVLHLNKELENTRISLGAIFNAQGFSKDIAQGMDLADKSITRMRKDAADLPGEFEDLKGIMMTIATPAMNAGMNIDALHKLSANTMAVSAVMGVPMDMAAREMGMLLSGRAGAHNVLGTRLGFSGDEGRAFNAKKPEDRVKALNMELEKYAPAIAVFAKSWEGVSSSTTSTMKILLTRATSPVFESMKETLGAVNAWFEKNKAKIDDWADFIGVKLNDAFHWGVTKIQEWYPIVANFAETTYFKMVAIWEKIEPYVTRFGTWMKKALEDPNGTLDKIKTVLELYAAVKVAGGIASAVGGAVQVGSGIATLLGRGAGAASAAAGAAGAVGTVGGFMREAAPFTGDPNAWGAVGRYNAVSQMGGYAAGGGMGLAGTAAQAAGGAWGIAAPSVGLLAGAATGAVVGITAFGWQLTELIKDMKHHSEGGVGAADEDKELTNSAWVTAGLRAASTVSESARAYEEATTMIRKLSLAGDEIGSAQVRAALELYDLAEATARVKNGFADIKWKSEVSDATEKLLSDAGENSFLKDIGKSLVGDSNKPKTPPAHPGGGGVHINVVEIQVTSNNEPGRVADLVLDKIQNMRRHRTADAQGSAFKRISG